jgi:pentatricopeptide repeat protein
MEGNPWLVQESPGWILSTYNNLMKSLFYLRKYEKVAVLLEKMYNHYHLSSLPKDVRRTLLENYYLLKSHNLFHTGNKMEIEAFLPELHSFLQRVQKSSATSVI